ncbi:hypothetical protein BDQ17DRAFT_633855 [Cyathus striatus]|nr:hypothetical protein BDQ17DRAFT_633855 [Cyathus striatus]
MCHRVLILLLPLWSTSVGIIERLCLGEEDVAAVDVSKCCRVWLHGAIVLFRFVPCSSCSSYLRSLISFVSLCSFLPRLSFSSLLLLLPVLLTLARSQLILQQLAIELDG